MNLNKNFLTEVIKYLISKGVTVHDVLDAFHAQFEYHEQNISRQDELRKPLTDIDLMLCGRSVEESSIPCEKVDAKPVTKSWIDYPKNIKNHGNGVSPARKALFDVVGDKTVIEHLRANGIDYKVYDNRVRRKWSVADACTTPLAPRGRHKSERVIEEPGEPETAVIIPDSVKVVEESSTPEKATESVTNETELNGNNVTAVILDTPNHDAIRKDKDDKIEKALKKFITSTTGIKYDESKKDKKPKEAKKDYTVADVCFKLNVTTHELRDMVSAGEFPQPDCGKKWSVKLLKEKNLI